MRWRKSAAPPVSPAKLSAFADILACDIEIADRPNSYF